MNWLKNEPSKSQRRSRFLKEAFKRLLGGESSFHSGLAGTLHLQIERLEEERVGYQLTAFPGRSYVLKRIEYDEYMAQERKMQKDAS